MSEQQLTTAADVDWSAWQRSWDRQQEWYMPDREERFSVMLDVVEAVVGPEPQVLDLACGTGSISDRLLRRLPGARTTGVDLDPALLTLARGHFADEPRAQFVTADLTDPGWMLELPHRSFDAILTATALHWLTTEQLDSLYRQLAHLVRDGGVFVNVDHMPDDTTPRLNEAVHAADKARRSRAKAEGQQEWGDWWADMAADPHLADVTARRFALFGDPSNGDHDNGQMQPVGWHTETLLSAGFAEARAVWASPSDAMVLALR